jgi:hypothetical protein
MNKTDMLSAIAKVYDPLGFAAPVILAGRLLFTKAFKSNDQWLAPVPEEFMEDLCKFIDDANAVDRITYPRFLVLDRNKPCHLSIFSDGSANSYGFCIYLSQISDEHEDLASVRLVCAKARLAPTGKKSILITVPRLELLGAVLATRAARTFLETAAKDLCISSITHFIDSQIVLHWLRNGSSLRAYEERRVQEILDAKVTKDHRYIRTSENPADACTKPLTLKALLQSSFHQGPLFLRSPFKDWPKWEEPPMEPDLVNGTPTGSMKVNAMATLAQARLNTLNSPASIRCEDYSSLDRLLAVTAYTLRIVRREVVRGYQDSQGRHRPTPPTEQEKDRALRKWIKYSQETEYPEVLAALRSENSRLIKLCKIIGQLDLFLDEEGLIRLGSRFANARDMGWEIKYPLLLPKGHYITRLLVCHVHTTRSHCSGTTLVNFIRQYYWICGGVNGIKGLLDCIVCKMTKAKPLPLPSHGQLPSSRLQPDLPIFHSIIIDQIGAIHVYNRGRTLSDKRWVLVFSCPASRVTHMELLEDYGAASVVHAFERFWARWGLTEANVYLDQATAFMGAKAFTDACLGATFQDHIVAALVPLQSHHRINFIPAPARAPWHQGAVERVNGLIKACLRPALWKKRVNEEELRTILARIEATINSRPLTAISSDPKDPLPLTPAHIAYPQARLQLPKIDVNLLPDTGTPAAKALRRQFLIRESILDEFWERWRREYINVLRSTHIQTRRRMKNRAYPAPRVGQLFLLADQTPRALWKTCRILETHPDRFGVVRYVTIVTSTGHETKRSVSHLVPLEADLDEEVNEMNETGEPDGKRDAAGEWSDGKSEEGLTPRARRAERRQRIRDEIFD